jgi:selenocysteine lyase/cysteine desulfurase
MNDSRLDLDFVRRQFPAFSEPSLAGQAFFENAGGSYACAQVVNRLNEYYRRLKVQPYYSYPASTEAGEWMDAAHARLAEYLGVTPDEVHFGPSTSQNTYVLAQAFRNLLKPKDEIIVTDQDHEANSGVWRRLAAHGVVVREWRVDRDTGALPVAEFDRLLTHRTRLLVFPHASNVVALAQRGLMTASGNFYAVRLLEAMGVDPARGAVRLSMVHYTSAAEITGLLAALDLVLGG